MPRQARAISQSGCYHIVMRGAGRRILFEDDEDREAFVRRLYNLVDDGVVLYAWCLMDNHVHLLIDDCGSSISTPLHKLTTSFALYFNGRHSHVGPVFQGRFSSFPVETDSYFLETVRYIHFNPKSLGATANGYRWSSYRDYLGREGLCETSRVLSMLGGIDAFRRFHQIEDEMEMVDLTGYRRRMSDAEVRSAVSKAAGEGFLDMLPLMEKAERDSGIRKLHRLGASTRQIERLTGIGRSVVRRACKKAEDDSPQ